MAYLLKTVESLCQTSGQSAKGSIQDAIVNAIRRWKHIKNLLPWNPSDRRELILEPFPY